MTPSNPSRRPQGMMIDLEIGKAPAPSLPPAGRVRATGGRPTTSLDPAASQAAGHQEPDGDETGTIACPGCGQLYKLVPAAPEMRQEEGEGMENEGGGGGGVIQSAPLSGTPGV